MAEGRIRRVQVVAEAEAEEWLEAGWDLFQALMSPGKGVVLVLVLRDDPTSFQETIPEAVGDELPTD